MSAIAGLVDWRGGPAAEAVRRATAALARHGRDGEGIWDGGDAALGWRQTILTEEDRADIQPVSAAAGRYKMVFDGRIDNREALGRALGIPAAESRAWPDSRWVLAAFSKWGEDCADHLLGDFAFAVWDSKSRSLFLSRDHVGSRPLHYHHGGGFFIFATRPSALFTCPRVPRDMDDEAFVLDLAFLPMDPDGTLYKGISRVRPGHSLVVTEAAIRSLRHWRVEAVPDVRYGRDEEYVEAFRTILDESVRCRLRTIHPIGSHLSSGWDSSTVTATAAHLLQTRNQRLTAFTAVPPAGWVGASVAGNDEGPISAFVASNFPLVEHVLVRGSGHFDLAILDRHAEAFENRLRSLTNVGWLESLHQDARGRGIRVMLTGGCGNSTISVDGTTLLPWLVRHGKFAQLASECFWLRRRTGRCYAGIVSQALFPCLPDWMWNLVLTLSGRPKPRNHMCFGICPDAMTYAKLLPIAKDRGLNVTNLHRDDRSARASLQALDRGLVMPSSLGPWDIDLRDPTTDRRLMDFRIGIPETQLLREGRTKWLLRRAMDGILPAELMNQRVRGVQGAEWCEAAARSRPEMRDEVERLGANRRMASLVDVPLLRRFVSEWPEAVRAGDKRELMLRKVLLVLGSARFMRRFIERESVGAN